MSQYTTGVNFNSNSGFFEVSSVDSSGKVSTQSVNFSTLCMMFSLDSLNAQDEVFATQFAAAEEQVSQLTMINDCMQMLNKYSVQLEDEKTVTLSGGVSTSDIQNNPDFKGYAGPDGKWTQTETNEALANYALRNGCTYVEIDGVGHVCEPGSDMEAWLTVYYPNLVATGLVQDGDGTADSTMGIGADGCFKQSELDTMMENLQSAQSTVSSQNEQQMLLTNDAANKRSTILQQAQTLLQAAQDARNAAAKT